jgi:PAS domain S-box-containing protein
MKFAEQFAASKDKDGLDVELNSKGTVNRIAQMKTSSGIRWHEITARHGKDPLTGETCILVSEVDISKMKATENRLRDIVDVSSDWFWEMDEDLRYTYFSERASEYSSIDPNSLIGKKRSDFILEMDDNWRAHLDDLDNRRPFRDFRFTKGDLEGRVRHTSVSGVPIYDEDDNFKGYRGAGTDITEHVEGKRRIAAQKTA